MSKTLRKEERGKSNKLTRRRERLQKHTRLMSLLTEPEEDDDKEN